MSRTRRSVPAAITLFFVAPFVAEYLLGDLSLKLLPALIVMAPMYGGGALLIREAVRRKGRGWPTILCLGAAYALLEEGLVTQSLFNPDYLKLHLHFLAPAHIAWLGTGAWWTLLMLNLHTFWSIGVSIALVEGLFPESVSEPWLGVVGETIFGGLFVLGLIVNLLIGYKQNQFWASPVQLGVTAVLCLLLVVVAFVTPAGMAKREGAVPAPWVTGVATLVLAALLQLVPMRWGWGAVAAMLAVDAVFSIDGVCALKPHGVDAAAYPQPGRGRSGGLRSACVPADGVWRRRRAGASGECDLFADCSRADRRGGEAHGCVGSEDGRIS